MELITTWVFFVVTLSLSVIGKLVNTTLYITYGIIMFYINYIILLINKKQK
jgi:hypothetical protein